MSTVAEIKAAISRLTLEERAEVARCLHEWEDNAWDKQMQQDLAAGKLDGLLAKVDDDIAHGKLRELTCATKHASAALAQPPVCTRPEPQQQ